VSWLEQFRVVATRYDKTAESFLDFAQLAAARIWLRFVHTPWGAERCVVFEQHPNR
jgi:hypothetical protein